MGKQRTATNIHHLPYLLLHICDKWLLDYDSKDDLPRKKTGNGAFVLINANQQNLILSISIEKDKQDCGFTDATDNISIDCPCVKKLKSRHLHRQYKTIDSVKMWTMFPDYNFQNNILNFKESVLALWVFNCYLKLNFYYFSELGDKNQTFYSVQ